MKTDALTALTSQLTRAPGSLTIADGNADFGAKLTLGQIIKGRVLRSYEGNRYLVDFNGQERVVDSSVPLRPDEVFRGRVVGLGDRVELQKLPSVAGDSAPPNAAPAERGVAARGDQFARELFGRYGTGVEAQTLEHLQQVAAREPDIQGAALAGLVLAKQGLPIAAEWVRVLQTRLAATVDMPAGRAALHLETVPAPMVLRFDAVPTSQPAAGSAAPPAATIPAMGAVLQELLMELPQAQAHTTYDDDTGDDAAAAGTRGGGERGGDAASNPGLADWILNGQTAGPIAHRLGMLQLVVDGRLLELEIAVFEEAGQRDGSPPQGNTLRHRQIVLSLDTEGLGRVDVNARLAGQHLHVQLATSSSESTAQLALHSHDLEQDLRGLGFQLDGLAYETHRGEGSPSPRTVVVEHIVNPGSVSRLV